MLEIVEMDKEVTLLTQMEEKGGPVFVINKFNVKPEEVEQFLNVWAADAAIMKRQPGFISARLHRRIAGSGVFLSDAVWESAEHLKQAYNHREFQALIAEYPSSVPASPNLFRKMAIPGVCLAGERKHGRHGMLMGVTILNGEKHTLSCETSSQAR